MAKTKSALTKDDLLEGIKGLSVIDLAELVKALEEVFGVSAAAPVAIPPPKGKKEQPGTAVEQWLARYASGSRILAVFDRKTGKQL